VITVYVAGPYTKPDPGLNTHQSILVATQLLDAGFAPFLPHLSLFWHCCTPRPYETWLQYDFVWVAKCDAVLRIPGDSPGADREVELANSLGIPVFFDIESLFAAYKRPQ